MFRYIYQKHMYTYDVYLERADDDESKKWIGTTEAVSGGQALELASQYYEIPPHDLVVKKKTHFYEVKQ